MLGRTHSAVSKQLHQLQDHAGVKLFEKRGAGVELTAEGGAFAILLTSGLDDIRKAYSSVRSHSIGQKVTLRVSSTFARVWAIPTVARFNMDHPDIEVQIILTLPQSNHNGDGATDLVLSWDRLAGPMPDRPDNTTLGDVHIGPVLSPVYSYQMQDNMFRFGTKIDRGGSESGWERWSEMTGITLSFENMIKFDLSALTFEAAERGMGVTLAPKFLIERELKSGTLVAPLGFLCFKEGLIVRPSSERPNPGKNAKILLEWLSEHGRLGDDGFLASALIEPVWG